MVNVSLVILFLSLIAVIIAGIPNLIIKSLYSLTLTWIVLLNNRINSTLLFKQGNLSIFSPLV